MIQAVLDDITGTTRVHFSESYHKKQDIDWGASASFQNWMRKALQDVLLPDT